MRISRRYGVEHSPAGWICLACGNVGPSAPRCDSSGLVRTGVYHDARYCAGDDPRQPDRLGRVPMTVTTVMGR